MPRSSSKHIRLRKFAEANRDSLLTPFNPFSSSPIAGRTRSRQRERANQVNFPESGQSFSFEGEVDRSFEEAEAIMERQQRTLKELAAPNFNPNLLCINYPDDEPEVEIKPGLIHALPIFTGFRDFGSIGSGSITDPNKFLKEFHIACSGMKPAGVTVEQLKLKAFPFALADAAKEWLYDLPAGSVNTWEQMQQAFLEKYFPASRATNIRKEICGIRQDTGESLHEYWERFKKLCNSCPNHQISEQLLIQYFYEGLLPLDRNMIDAASGGALVDRTLEDAKSLIATMAGNSQYWGSRNSNPSSVKQVKDTSISKLEQQVANLTSLVQQAVMGKGPTKVCGICALTDHLTDACPSLQDEQQVNAVGGFQGQQRKYDPFAPTYNQGWKDHPNFRYGNQQQGNSFNARPPAYQQQQGFHTPPGFHQQQPQFQQRAPPPPQPQSQTAGGMSLEEIVKSLATNTSQFQQETRSGMQETRSGLKNLENQVSQLADAVGKLQTLSSTRLPSQPERNPREDACAITLRSGKEIQGPKKGKEKEVEEETETTEQKKNHPSQVNTSHPEFNDSPFVPFPSRLAKNKHQEKEKEILEVFRKVEVNIPLLEAIKQVPRYAKFLKELCTNKRKLRGDEKISVGGNVSAVLQRKLPPKCKDPGIFTIPCKIGNMRYEKCMLDLGASINVMPLSIFKALNLGSLKDTRVVIQLADKSNTYPEGVIEDVLVQVNELVFPVDFYVLDMHDEGSSSPSTILLGRPFLKTSKTKIDVDAGTLTMEFDGEVIRFNIFDTMRYPSDCESVAKVDIRDSLVEHWSIQ